MLSYRYTNSHIFDEIYQLASEPLQDMVYTRVTIIV